MTLSDEPISLASAFDSVMLSPGAASTLLQWMALQIGHDTEAGAALRDAGIVVSSPEPEEPPVDDSNESETTGDDPSTLRPRTSRGSTSARSEQASVDTPSTAGDKGRGMSSNTPSETS